MQTEAQIHGPKRQSTPITDSPTETRAASETSSTPVGDSSAGGGAVGDPGVSTAVLELQLAATAQELAETSQELQQAKSELAKAGDIQAQTESAGADWDPCFLIL